MAIYKLSMKVGKTNSKKHYEYISRRGSYKNYNKGEDLIYEKSFNLPGWANESGKEYWQAVNDFEKGTHYREIELTLPSELNHEENKNLLEEFCQETFGEKYTYSYSFHENIGKLSGKKNPHAHIMFSERIIDKEREEPDKLDYFKQRRKDKKTGKYKNGYVKDREITGKNRKKWLLEKRKLWADIQNKHLLENGKMQRVSHLSLKEQGIDRIPQIHLGAATVNMHLRGEETGRWKTYKEIEQDNIKLEKLEQEIKEYEKYLHEKERVDKEISYRKERISNLSRDKYNLEEKIKDLESEITKTKEDKEILDYMNYAYIRWLKNVEETKIKIQKYEEKDITSKILKKGVSQLFGKVLDRYEIEDEYEKYLRNKEYYKELMKEKEEHKEHELYEIVIKEQEEKLKEITKKLSRLNIKYNELGEQLYREKKEVNNIEYEQETKCIRIEHKASILNFKDDMLEKYRVNEKDAVQIEIGLNSGLNEYDIEYILEKYIETEGKIDLEQEIDSLINYNLEIEKEIKDLEFELKKTSRGWGLER